MRSVAYTDVLQFILVVLVLSIITNVLVYKIGGLPNLFQRLPAEKLAILSYPNLSRRIIANIFWGVFPTFTLTPPIIQRMLMVQDKRQVKKMFFAGAAIYSVVILMLVVIGLGAVSYFKNLPAQLAGAKNAESLIAYVGKELFSGNDLMKLFLFIGLMFVLLSTMDSYLHTAGVSLVHDVIKPFCDKRKVMIDETTWSRVATLLIGSLTCWLAYSKGEWLGKSTIYAYMYAVLVSGMTLMPLIFGILGVKAKQDFFSSILHWVLCYHRHSNLFLYTK